MEEPIQTQSAVYDESAIQTLAWNEHIRRRPGMYIGKLGDGSHQEDGIYVLLKEVVDNSVDEFNMHFGRQIDIWIEGRQVTVRDYGRGIPQGKIKEATSDINTGGKFDSKFFQKSVGLNGVGLKAVNALSEHCEVVSFRDGFSVKVEYRKGDLVDLSEPQPTTEPNGTLVRFTPDDELFRDYAFRDDFVETMVRNYTYLNTGLAINLNGRRFLSRHGLLDLLQEKLKGVEPLYPIIHFKEDDIEMVFTHTNRDGEEYYSFVNGQHTTQGGTHLTAFRESLSRTIKEYFGKPFEYSDIRSGIVGAISIRIQEPVFESQTKTRLGSREISPDSPVTVNKFVGDFVKKELDDYLHKNLDIAEVMLKKIQESEKERKAMAGVTKLARERAKKVSLHNRKLRDCSVHYSDSLKPSAKADRRDESSIFITEGDSASGTITKARDALTQAVFSLRGKPLNSYGLTRKVVYENEEFNLLQAALNIEDGIDGLRYNKVIIATDADVDGMHIRLLVITFFLQFFPDLIKEGHVYILQTPLFRVRDKRASRRKSSAKRKNVEAAESPEVFYCYTDEERVAAIEHFGANAEITRFKGLGEINVEEFRDFIGEGMRLDPVTLQEEDAVAKLLEFYMGKNTMTRQNFIIDNLVVEDDSQIN